MKTIFVRFVNDESGSAALEFGLFLAILVIAILAVVRRLGKNLSSDKPQITPNGTSKASAWRESLPTTSEVHVASIIRIAEKRKASRIQGAP